MTMCALHQHVLNYTKDPPVLHLRNLNILSGGGLKTLELGFQFKKGGTLLSLSVSNTEVTFFMFE